MCKHILNIFCRSKIAATGLLLSIFSRDVKLTLAYYDLNVSKIRYFCNRVENKMIFLNFHTLEV